MDPSKVTDDGVVGELVHDDILRSVTEAGAHVTGSHPRGHARRSLRRINTVNLATGQ